MREPRYDIPPGRIATLNELDSTCELIMASYDQLTGGRVTNGTYKTNERNQPTVVVAFCRAKHCFFYNAYVVTSEYIGWLEIEG